MDDPLRELLTETNESLDTVDNQLVRFEQDPNNAKILDNIFAGSTPSRGRAAFPACRGSRRWRMRPGAIEAEGRICSWAANAP
jgi:chemotaxis protein histidine kinase CheA